MFKKIFFLILIIELSTVCECVVSQFFGHDSAIIVDAEKTVAQNKYNALQFPVKIRMAAPFPMWRRYLRYHIIPPLPPGQVLAINKWAKTAKSTGPFTPTPTNLLTKSTTTATIEPRRAMLSTSTLSPFVREDEFPAELIDIARNKLGLKSFDEIPSISELGQLVGTNSPEETLKYIKKLALNEQGIALLKAYIESADYTDKTGELVNNNEDLRSKPTVHEEEDDEMGDFEEPLRDNDEDLVVVTDEDSNDDGDIDVGEELTQDSTSQTIQELPESSQGLVERLTNFVHMNTLFNNVNQQKQDEDFDLVNRITENGKAVSKEEKTHTNAIQDKQLSATMKKSPVLLKDSIPFNYPIPIRIQSTTTTATIPPTASNTSAVHLNTPKVLVPHVHQISRVTKVPVKQIEDFVASKPKLLDLVTKVSRLPIGYDRNSPIEAQVLAVVQKAFEEDDDLKRLLSSTATLK